MKRQNGFYITISNPDKENAEKVMEGIKIAKCLQETKHCDELKIEDNQMKLF